MLHTLWAMAAGAFIPVMAVLNARLGRSLTDPLHAVFILFAVGFVVSGLACLILTGSLLAISKLSDVAPINFSGGLIVAFYVFSVTLLAPRFGIGNTILFVETSAQLTAQPNFVFAMLAVQSYRCASQRKLRPLATVVQRSP
jgi:uncharacterized membrane protein YdcZ (DUF606 family)